ncbi:MAG: methyltransferase [Acidocella sp. 20-57-95]|nr:MAG: methyltransferase [Acidocella sp. 20-57-95]HQT63110.1 class I SAM-dependent methyltransferase [Acidocella sp.]HQU05004.1 class I SAM-dependent methyltransferase [Acidocella sp.]
MNQTAPAVSTGSPERFGYSWDNYAELLPVHEAQFQRWTTPLQPDDWRGKRFLDAGCGMGRNSYWPLKYGAASSVSIDVDDRTLARACETLSPFPQAEIRHLSIYDIPDTNAFDIVFSIGVVHHLADPDAALARLMQAACPGGIVLVWLYGAENNGWIIHLFNPLRQALFSRLPLKIVHALSIPLTAILWLGLRAGFGRLAYMKLIRGFSFRHLRAIVFDHMIPRIAVYYTKAEAIALLTRAGLENVQAHWTNEMSWSVMGRKPL